MCNKQHARKLVDRLKVLPFYGDEDEKRQVRAEAGKALMDAAVSDDHATAIAESLLARLHRFPVPADIREEAAGTKPREAPEFDAVALYGPKPAVECGRCQDMGWFPSGKAFEQCGCRWGRGLEDFVAKLNKPMPTRRITGGRSMTSAEFAQKAGL